MWNGEDSAGGSAGFFYFVNVTALIYVIFICFVYVIFWGIYQTEKRLPLVDLGATALFFVLFFFCSSIWWAGANTIGTATSDERLKEIFQRKEWVNQSATYSNRDVNNGQLAISVVRFLINCFFPSNQRIKNFSWQTGCVSSVSPSIAGLYIKKSFHVNLPIQLTLPKLTESIFP